MRMIDADLLERKLFSLAEKYVRKRPRLALALTTTINIIRCMDVTEESHSKHGHWTIKQCGWSDYDCVCSECGKSGVPDYNYCPTCGAKMDGGEKDA